jgi:hypothetical protein
LQFGVDAGLVEIDKGVGGRSSGNADGADGNDMGVGIVIPVGGRLRGMRIVTRIGLTEDWLAQNPAGSQKSTHEHDEKLSHESSFVGLSRFG